MKRRSLLQTTILCLSVVLLTAPACKSDDDPEPAAESAEQLAEGDQKTAGYEEKDSPEAADEAGEQPTEKAAKLPEDLPAGETGTYGGDFTIDSEPVSLASALEEAESGQTYKVTARVEKVCKKKGCWFTLDDEGVEEPVRVKMKDYGFFVPRNSDGATAIVEGELQRRTVPQAEAQHYADDEVAGTDQEPEKVEGDQETWEMMITAAQVEMPAEKDSAEN